MPASFPPIVPGFLSHPQFKPSAPSAGNVLNEAMFVFAALPRLCQPLPSSIPGKVCSVVRRTLRPTGTVSEEKCRQQETTGGCCVFTWARSMAGLALAVSSVSILLHKTLRSLIRIMPDNILNHQGQCQGHPLQEFGK